MECCKKGESCVPCPYFIKKIDCAYKRRAEGDALDLIHRLQSENERLKKRHGVVLLRNDDLDLENYELKKQVDELKAGITQVVENYEKEMPKVLEEVEKEIEEIQQQAVKDTAKECYQKLVDWGFIEVAGDIRLFRDKFNLWIKERYGVEVE